MRGNHSYQYYYISSFTNSFFPLAQVKKVAKRDKSGRLKKLHG